MSVKLSRNRFALSGALALATLVLSMGGAGAASNTFSFGQLAAGAGGWGVNQAGEPAAHGAAAGTVFVGSERGLGGGSDGWVGLNQVGGAAANACAIRYVGQPNAVAGFGASGGDIDSAWASAPGANGNYALYVASLNLGSVAVAHSTDNGAT